MLALVTAEDVARRPLALAAVLLLAGVGFGCPPGVPETTDPALLARLAAAIRANYRLARSVDGIPIWVRSDRPQ